MNMRIIQAPFGVELVRIWRKLIITAFLDFSGHEICGIHVQLVEEKADLAHHAHRKARGVGLKLGKVKLILIGVQLLQHETGRVGRGERK